MTPILILTDISAREEVIQVRVGESKDTFSVHKALLCSTSQFFQAKQKEEWSKGDPVIKAPYDVEEAFNLYVNWLYTCRIPTAAMVTDNHGENENEWKVLAHAYALGDAILDTPFMDTVVDAMHAKIRSHSGHTIWACAAEIIDIIYAPPAPNPAKRLLADLYAQYAGEQEMAALAGKGNQEFFHDVAAAPRTDTAERSLRDFDSFLNFNYSRCKYHSHRDPEKCYLQEADKA